VGGSGGGGTGQTSGSGGTNGAANLGGGGGGNKIGGSGVVIISFNSSYATPAIDAGLVYNETTSGSNKIITFTSGTGTITWEM
jgi:hypothetical protein